MAEGTSTFEGLSLPRLGEYEQVQQTVATDMVTLTGGTSMTGDFIVCQNSTGAELFVVDSDGSSAFILASTTAVAGVTITVTSTGALAAAGEAETYASGVVVVASSKSVLNSAFAYAGGGSHYAVTNSAKSLIGQMGANSAPGYFLSVAGTGTDIYDGAIGDQGFIDSSMAIITFTSANPFIGVKCSAGSVEFYLVGVQATGVS